MPDSFVNARPGPQDLESGRVLAPGESVPASGLNLKGAHDSRLVAEGSLLQAEPASRQPARNRSTEEDS